MPRNPFGLRMPTRLPQITARAETLSIGLRVSTKGHLSRGEATQAHHRRTRWAAAARLERRPPQLRRVECSRGIDSRAVGLRCPPRGASLERGGGARAATRRHSAEDELLL